MAVSSISITVNEVDFQVIDRAAEAETFKFNVENGLQEERV